MIMVTKKMLRNTLTTALAVSILLCACTKEETYGETDREYDLLG